MHFTNLDWAIVVGYFAVVLFIGIFFSRKHEGDKSFFLGSQNMPMWAVALSVVATSLSTVTFMGAPQEAFKSDLSYLILNVGGIIAVFLVAVFFIPAFYRSKSMTIYGYLEKRFNSKVRVMAGFAFLAGRLLASGARLFAASLGVSLLLYGSANIGKSELVMTILLLGVIGTIYTLSGGIKSVIWTDVMQIVVIIFSAVLSLIVLYNKIPLDFGGIWEHLSQAPSSYQGGSKLSLVHTELDLASPYTLWTGFFIIIFMNMASYGVDQDLVQRMMTCKCAWRGGLALILSNILNIFIILVFMCIGLLLYLYSDPEIMGREAAVFERTELVYPQFLIEHLPAGISGLAMAGLLAAAMSSLDSAINAMASSSLADVLRPIKRAFGQESEEFQEGTKVSRIAVALMGTLLTMFAIMLAFMYDAKSDTLLGFALGVMAYSYAGLLGVFLTGIFTNRGNTQSVVAAFIGGAAVVFFLQPSFFPAWLGVSIAWPWWMFFGTCASFILCVSGSPESAFDSEPILAYVRVRRGR